METNKVIEFFDNKKLTIYAIIVAIMTWSLGRGYIAQDTMAMIADIAVALGIGANVITSRYNTAKKQELLYALGCKREADAADRIVIPCATTTGGNIGWQIEHPGYTGEPNTGGEQGVQ
jgi:hypothetical protein